MSLIAHRYAKALFLAATEKDAVDAVDRDLITFGAALENEEIRGILLNPDTGEDTRSKALQKLAAGGHELTRSLIGVLLRRRRVEVLPELPDAFRALVRASRNEADGVIESARELAPEQIAELEKVAARLSGKTVTLTQRVMPELLGGVRLRVANTLYDGSVATALQELEQQLMAAPLS